MNIEQFLTEASTRDIAIENLVAIAADRAAHGDDIVAAFKAQAQRRADARAAIHEAVDARDGRDPHASEQRKAHKLADEMRQILDLTEHVQTRGERAYVVPESQASATRDAETAAPSPVVTREQNVRGWLESRGSYDYQGERGASSMRLGAIVRGMIGHRDGLSALERRALSEGSDSAGGYTVPEILSAQFIDRVRNNMAVMRAGAVTVPMQSDVMHLARLGQPDSVSPPIDGPSWKVENNPIDEYDMVLERVTLTARTLPILIKLSVELSEDSANIDAIIEQELAQALALELDRAALLGSGSAPQPRGIRNQSGVGVTSFSGVTPTNYDFLIDAIGRVWSQNHEPTARIYNASLATTIAKFKSSSDSQPLRVPDVVAAVPAFRTNQIPVDGVSPDTTTMIVGDFSQLMIGLRTSFRLEASRVAGDSFSKLQIAVRAYLRADVQLAHPQAFDVTTNVGY